MVVAMHEFTLWAPKAKRVAVAIGDAQYPMSGPDEKGHWNVSVEGAGYGLDYAFVLDGDTKQYPDPRSLWQPNGVHGSSRLYDQAAFQWSDGRWNAPLLERAVIYELHIGTFTSKGTFDAAIERLDYLFELGVTHVEMMPVAAFPGSYGWGYDGASLFAVNDLYGGPDGLKRLVDACHARGLAVLLDVVYNHFGPVGNYSGMFGPYMTGKHRTPWGDAVNFEDGRSDEVRRFFCDNALMWLRDYHIDGLRLDAVHEFVDRSGVHFWEQLSVEVEGLSASLRRRLVLIAESDLNDPRVVTSRKDGGYGVDVQWSDDFHHALFAVLNDGGDEKGYYIDFGSLEDLAKSLTKVFVYDGAYSHYRMRNHGRPVEQLSAHHFLGYIQTHDQVGNRAIGDRLEQIVGIDRAKVAAGIVLMAPFIPMIFQGEEFAASSPFQYFADHEDAEMARSVKAGRQGEFAAFGWNPNDIPDPGKRETFERSKLKWDEVREGQHAEMLEWYRKLIRLRHNSPSLNDGDLRHVKVQFDEKKRWLTMERGLVKMFCNLGDAPVEFNKPERISLLLTSRKDVEEVEEKVVLPPDTLAILSAALDI
jgi:maltooligosyltrehalose trehalohydrolase